MQPIIVHNQQFETLPIGPTDRASFFQDYRETVRMVADIKGLIGPGQDENLLELVDQLRLGQSLLYREMERKIGAENAELIAAKVSLEILIESND